MDISALRKAIGAADTVPEADVISQAAAKLGTIPTLEQAKTTAEADLATVRTELSRRPAAKDPDPDVLAERAGVKVEKVEHLVTTGAISEHQADFLRKRINGADGKPNAIMLSRSGDESPVDALIAFASMGRGGVNATGEQRTGVQELSRQTHDHSGVTTGTGDATAEAKRLEEQAREYAKSLNRSKTA